MRNKFVQDEKVEATIGAEVSQKVTNFGATRKITRSLK